MNKKYDFFVALSVKNANPNGDPLNENRPRINYDGIGEISDVCIKRKIRNRLQDMGHAIFVQSDDNRKDEYISLKDRASNVLSKETLKDKQLLYDKACETWIDVRAFGQLFAFSGGKEKGVSVGIRGPVSIQSAFSVHPVSINSLQITKSVSSEGDGKTRGSDTMGMKHRVEFGLYTFAGSINTQLAEKTGFEHDDAMAIKEALRTLFENDASSARPEGSMEVIRVYWWEHNSKTGQYSSAKVHRSVRIEKKDGVLEPKSIDDYEFFYDEEAIPGLKVEFLEGM